MRTFLSFLVSIPVSTALLMAATALEGYAAPMGLGDKVISVPASSNEQTVKSEQDASSLVVIASPYFAPEPHSPEPVAGTVLAALRKLEEAYVTGDFKKYIELLDDDCSEFESKSGKHFSGKGKIVDYLQQRRTAQLGKEQGDKKLHVLVQSPQIKVVGEMAVVTYKRFEHYGSAPSQDGKNGTPESAFVTAIFTQSGDVWKKVQETTNF